MNMLTMTKTFAYNIPPIKTGNNDPKEPAEVLKSKASFAEVKGVSNIMGKPKINVYFQHISSHLGKVINTVYNVLGKRQESEVARDDCKKVRLTSVSVAAKNTLRREYIVLNPNSTDRLI